jgi:hypothetical protein
MDLPSRCTTNSHTLVGSVGVEGINLLRASGEDAPLIYPAS